ncbi:MAG: hypothetical protein GX802_06405 [Clostridiales bacterium]|nr:hypothetical protein [Clostridiales bacterium]
MVKFREYIQAHKALSYVFGLGFIVFFNCFGFPFYNISKEWPLSIILMNIYLSLASSYCAGIVLAGLFPKKKYWFIACLMILFACIGLACRYLLEFGEVSNIYNFTIPNILLHLGVFVILTSLWWQYANKKSLSV